ncbi:MAG: ferrochelatase [Acidimicrobiia bacterium]
MSENRLAVLLVGFGGPETMDEVPAFVESVLDRQAPANVVASVIERYRTIGGGSPLPATSRRQAVLVSEELVRLGVEAEVYVGMLHARPTIDEAIAKIAARETKDLIVISLAPYRCEVSTDAYEAAVERAIDGKGPRLRFALDWNLATGYVSALAEMLAEARREGSPDTPVIFTAHSLPRRMIEQGDPYAEQLEATAGKVAAQVGLADWHLAYQSVSAAAREPWLGPSVEAVMDRLAATGATSVLVDPIGFISDHVETLYDNDIEHRGHAQALGMEFHRCRCLNHHPGLIETLADLALATADRV